METAHVNGITVRWRIKNREDSHGFAHTCAVPKCNRAAGPTYLGLVVCNQCLDKHLDESSKFSLARFADGENSKLVVNSRLKGLDVLETLGENGSGTLVAGSEVLWRWYGSTFRGRVEGMTTKNSDTVNRMAKAAPIKDIVIVWVKPDKGKREGLIPQRIEPLTESDEEESIDGLLDLLGG